MYVMRICYTCAVYKCKYARKVNTYSTPPHRALNVLIPIALETMSLASIAETHLGYHIAGSDDEGAEDGETYANVFVAHTGVGIWDLRLV